MFFWTTSERPLYSGQLPVISCSVLERSSGSSSALRLMSCLELHRIAKLSNICLRDQRDKQTTRDDGWPTDKRREKTSMFPTQLQTMNVCHAWNCIRPAWKCWYSVANKTDPLPIKPNCGEMLLYQAGNSIGFTWWRFSATSTHFFPIILSHNQVCEAFMYEPDRVWDMMCKCLNHGVLLFYEQGFNNCSCHFTVASVMCLCCKHYWEWRNVLTKVQLLAFPVQMLVASCGF